MSDDCDNVFLSASCKDCGLEFREGTDSDGGTQAVIMAWRRLRRAVVNHAVDVHGMVPFLPGVPK